MQDFLTKPDGKYAAKTQGTIYSEIPKRERSEGPVMGKYPHTDQAKRNIPIRVAAVLFCLTLLSTYLVTGLFARYTSSAESSDHARVAKFSIRGGLKDGAVLSQSIEASLAPGGTQPATIIIENNSEVAVEYTITVKNETNNLPLSFRMEKGGSSPDVTRDGATFTAQQLPGDHTDKYTLYIEWPKPEGDGKEQENREKELSRMGMVDHITVTVTAAQID